MPLSESQKGRIVEQLVGATLLLQSDGALRISLPIVDDEGVDLIVSNRQNDRSMLLQVKSRFSLTGRGRYRTNVRRATCHPNPSKCILMVYYDRQAATFGNIGWLIPSTDFCQLLANQRRTRSVYVFDSGFASRHDMWHRYQVQMTALAHQILGML